MEEITEKIEPNEVTEIIPNHIVIITYRLKDHEKFIPSEEIFLESFFQLINEKYELIKYHSSEITSFLGKLPCLYFNKCLVLNKDIPNFIYEIVTEDSHESQILEQKQMFDNIVFICKEELRRNNEYYSYLKYKAKLDKSKNIWTYLFKNFYKNDYYERLMSQTIKDYSPLNTADSCINNIKTSFYKLNILKGNDLGLGLGLSNYNNKFPNNKLFVAGILLYSFLKEDKLMFEEVKRPEIENLKYEENTVSKSLENFYVKFDRLFYNTINAKITSNLSINKESLDKALQLYCMSFDPIAAKEKNKKQKEMSEIQNTIHWKYNLFSFGMFIGIGSIFYFLSTRKKDTSEIANKSNTNYNKPWSSDNTQSIIDNIDNMNIN